MNAIFLLHKLIPALSQTKELTPNQPELQVENVRLELPKFELPPHNSEQPPEKSAQMKSPEFISKVMPNVWVYEGDAYDLSDFIKHHPGGEFLIGRMKNRDITTLVNVLHRNPTKVKRRLQKYALGRKATPQDLHPKYNAPPFLFKPDFDGREDTPHFNFKPSQLLDRIRSRVEAPEMRAKVDRMDSTFDLVTVLLAVAYVLVQILRLCCPSLSLQLTKSS